ncbi:hypothetical protein SAMN04488071_2086 [Kordiimonas lacus]|uniref:Transposase n=1 Tax=Kordiimonas lacus TaxID=637679 RepID=A0A1G7A7B2_9PROT|nr:hypothetical protein SAMN04488071_2086 [Kordiimonas lacus]
MVHKRHSSDFKREAVKLALTSGLPHSANGSPNTDRIRKAPVSPWEALMTYNGSLPGSVERTRSCARSARY